MTSLVYSVGVGLGGEPGRVGGFERLIGGVMEVESL